MPRHAVLLALALAATAARAAPPEPAPASPVPPTSPPSDKAPPHGAEEPQRPWVMGFAAELGGSPAVFGAKLGTGVVTRGEDALSRRWMIWLEADGTDWFRPDRPDSPNRVDRLLWAYPHVELARQLVRRPGLSGWFRAGPTLGRYTVNDGSDVVWFPGVAVGAGLLLDPVRLGVTWFGQWKTSTIVVDPKSFASPDVRMYPMLLFTAGLEFLQPFPR
jgi:hypothetical protein